MNLKEFLKGLRGLNAPDQGMRYHAGGVVRTDRQFDPYTGERLAPEYRAAELTIYGERAAFVYDLIRSAEALAQELTAPTVMAPLGASTLSVSGISGRTPNPSSPPPAEEGGE